MRLAFQPKLKNGFKWLSLFFLALIIFGLLLKERANVPTFFLQVGWVTLALNVVAMALGYVFSTLAKLDRKSTVAITAEVGIQNGTFGNRCCQRPLAAQQSNYGNSSCNLLPADVYNRCGARTLGKT